MWKTKVFLKTLSEFSMFYLTSQNNQCRGISKPVEIRRVREFQMLDGLGTCRSYLFLKGWGFRILGSHLSLQHRGCAFRRTCKFAYTSGTNEEESFVQPLYQNIAYSIHCGCLKVTYDMLEDNRWGRNQSKAKFACVFR